jgi:hypothetical protein
VFFLEKELGPPKLSFHMNRSPKLFLNYVALMSSIIDEKPSSYEEAVGEQVLKGVVALMSSIIDAKPSSYEEAVGEKVLEGSIVEYNSIMKNDVWEIVLKPMGKSVINSRWLYKVKHAIDGNIEKYKVWFIGRGFSKRVSLL